VKEAREPKDAGERMTKQISGESSHFETQISAHSSANVVGEGLMNEVSLDLIIQKPSASNLTDYGRRHNTLNII
jgi:hypothetical protein